MLPHSRNRFLRCALTVVLFLLAGPASASVHTSVLATESGAGTHVSSAGDGDVIAYYDANNKNLKLATCLSDCTEDTPQWQIVVVDDDGVDGDVGGFVSVQVDSQGRPVLAYYDWQNTSLKLATCISDCRSTAPEWEIVVVDDGGLDEAHVGTDASLQLDAQDRPVIAYYDASSLSLKLATCTAACQSAAATWQIVFVDVGGDEKDVGMHASLQLDSADGPVIAYYDWHNQFLKLATCLDACQEEAPTWVIIHIAENGDAGEYASLQLAAGDMPVIAYHSWYNSFINLATCVSDCRDGTNSQWRLRNVDYVDYYSRSSLQLDEQDRPLISYTGKEGVGLRLATCYVNCQEVDAEWSLTTLDDNVGTESYSALRLDDTGSVRVAYYSSRQDALKSAVLRNPPHVASVSAPYPNQYLTQDVLTFTVHFDLPVYLTGSASLALRLNSGTVLAAYRSGSGTQNLVFSYTVQADDADYDGIEIDALMLDDDSRLTDETLTHNADLTLQKVADTTELLVNQSTYNITAKVSGGGRLLEGAASRIVPHGQATAFTLITEPGFDTFATAKCEFTQALGPDNTVIITIPTALRDCELSVAFISLQSLDFVKDEEYYASGALELINVAPAYAQGLSGAGVRVGVIDNGLYADSVEFYGTNVVGYNFYDNADNLGGAPSHGTPVSGVIAGRRNGFGIQGIAYEADLAIAVGLTQFVSENAMVGSFDFMRELGVRVINNSWGVYSAASIDGSKGLAENTAILEALFDENGFWPVFDAIKNTVIDDSIVVFANGNTARDQVAVLTGLPYYYPDLQSNFIAVAAVDASGEIASFSNRCGVAAAWCVAAPGVDLLSPGYTGFSGNQFLWPNTGTSFAAPLVSGLSALLLEQFPWMSGTQIVSTVLTTASNGTDEVLSPIIGRGIINVGKAIDGPAAFEFDFLADTQGQDDEFANTIIGVGGLTKSGAGTLRLSGLNSYSGLTKLLGGQLQVDGSLSSSTLVEGGTLSGTGRVAALTVDAGILAPGASAGTLTTGNLQLGVSAILDFELDTSTEIGAGVNDPEFFKVVDTFFLKPPAILRSRFAAPDPGSTSLSLQPCNF